MGKAVVLRNAGQSAYVIITQLTTFVAIGPKELIRIAMYCVHHTSEKTGVCECMNMCKYP